MKIINEGATNLEPNVLQENKICFLSRRFYVQESMISGTTFIRATVGHNVTLKADSHMACRAHAAPMPFPCHARAAKGLECVFPV